MWRRVKVARCCCGRRVGDKAGLEVVGAEIACAR